jgi:hypothetical protein
MFQQYEKDSNNFPISINNSENGLLLCGTCHSNFDSHIEGINGINISEDGTIEVRDDLQVSTKYKDLNGKKVKWSNMIGRKDYPTAVFLGWVRNKRQRKQTNTPKRKEKQGKEEKESDDDESPSKYQKVQSKKGKGKGK